MPSYIEMPNRTPVVYWLLKGPKQLASSRLHGYQIHNYLLEHGWESIILYDPICILRDLPITAVEFEKLTLFRSGDVVVFQKISGAATVAAMGKLRTKGVVVVFIDCDFPPKLAEAQLADVTVCSSEQLAIRYRKLGISNVKTLPEAYEYLPEPRKVEPIGTIRCVWFGLVDGQKKQELEWLRGILSDHFPHYKLITVSNAADADYKWDLKQPWNIIGSCDIALVTGNKSQKATCKSPNRIIQAMALGLPIIAYPIPSYKKIIRPGRNGLLCLSDEEWIDGLKKLENHSTRQKMASVGHRYARRFYNQESVGREWAQFLSACGNPRSLKPHWIEVCREAIQLIRLRHNVSRRMMAEIQKRQKSQ